jgi:TetR/AcrR family transcriptional regulator
MPRTVANNTTSAETKVQISEAATSLFADHGYAAVSIREIASAAEVNIPTIYHYFGDKRALYLACCETVFTDASDQLIRSLEAKKTPRENILNFISTLYEMLARDTALSRLYLRELADRDESGLELLADKSFVFNYKAFLELLSEISDNAPEPADVASIFALTFGLSQIRTARNTALSTQSITRIKGPKKVAEYVLSTFFPELA